MTCTNWRNSCIFVWPTVYLYWICARTFTRSKWWNAFNGSQSTPNLHRKLSRNMTFDKWWNSYIFELHAA